MPLGRAGPSGAFGNETVVMVAPHTRVRESPRC